MEGIFQVCRNCKRSASGHLALHETHCQLFLVLCPECKGPVLQTEVEEHRHGGHQQTKECQERLVECQFCELPVRLNKVEIHKRHCGRRTELCAHCGRYITLGVLAQHDMCRAEQTPLRRGKRIPGPESNICCHYCKHVLTGNKCFHHLDRCHPVSDSARYFPTGKPEMPPSSLSSEATENQTSTAEKDVRPKMKNVYGFPLPSEKSTRQAPRGTNKTTDPPLKSDAEDEAAYDILRGCSQCGILLPLPTLNQHQEKCWQLASSTGKQGRSSS
uniref:XIAP associated factor 1 n=1 Tax=Catagonus wagneri TaxID=51154 RepID=A0A8C3YV26_9CETA